MWWRSRLRSVDRSLRSARFSAGILYDPRLLISSFNQFHIALFKTLSDCQQSKVSSGGRNCSNFAELRGCCSPFGPPLLSPPPPLYWFPSRRRFYTAGRQWERCGGIRHTTAFCRSETNRKESTEPFAPPSIYQSADCFCFHGWFPATWCYLLSIWVDHYFRRSLFLPCPHVNPAFAATNSFRFYYNTWASFRFIVTSLGLHQFNSVSFCCIITYWFSFILKWLVVPFDAVFSSKWFWF